MWRTVSLLNSGYASAAAAVDAAAAVGEAIDSLPTKNFVELRSNDVGITAGERGLIPGLITRESLDLNAVA